MSNSVDPDQDQRSVGPDLDPDCLYINSLNISEEMLYAPHENCCCFHYINICLCVGYKHCYMYILYCIVYLTWKKFDKYIASSLMIRISSININQFNLFESDN